MLFFYPMWGHESQRLGKQQCTPLGYRLHGVAELLGFIGFRLLLGTGSTLIYRAIAGTFGLPLAWLLALPFGLGLTSEALYLYSRGLANRQGFHYDDEAREASWMKGGQRQVYKWQA